MFKCTSMIMRVWPDKATADSPLLQIAVRTQSPLAYPAPQQTATTCSGQLGTKSPRAHQYCSSNVVSSGVTLHVIASNCSCNLVQRARELLTATYKL